MEAVTPRIPRWRAATKGSTRYGRSNYPGPEHKHLRRRWPVRTHAAHLPRGDDDGMVPRRLQAAEHGLLPQDGHLLPRVRHPAHARLALHPDLRSLRDHPGEHRRHCALWRAERHGRHDDAGQGHHDEDAQRRALLVLRHARHARSARPLLAGRPALRIRCHRARPGL